MKKIKKNKTLYRYLLLIIKIFSFLPRETFPAQRLPSVNNKSVSDLTVISNCCKCYGPAADIKHGKMKQKNRERWKGISFAIGMQDVWHKYILHRLQNWGGASRSVTERVLREDKTPSTGLILRDYDILEPKKNIKKKTQLSSHANNNGKTHQSLYDW